MWERERIVKTLKKIIIVLVLILVGLVFFLRYFGGATIKQAVNTGGPMVLGVPVSLQDAKLRPLAGHVYLAGLHVGNPEGFQTDGIFDLGYLDIKMDTRSLMSDTIRIQKIEIKDPKITLERGLTKSNLGALLENLEGEKKESGEGTPASKNEKKEEGGKKVVIDEISISGAQLNLSIKGMAGLSAPLPLPPLTLRDIGKEDDGASLTDVLARIVKAILGSATQVATGAGKLVGEGAKAVGDGAMAVGGVAVDGATAVGGAAVDGAAAVGGAVAGGAKAVGGAAASAGGAVLDGAGSVVKGIGGLFGAGDKKDEGEAEEPASK